MAKLIDRYGNKEEIPYYFLEQKFIDIIENSNDDIKSEFEQFKQNYHYFTPYFDFAILYLGYMIENPMGYEGRLLVSKDDKIYILENMNYEKYIQGNIEYPSHDFFVRCDDKTLQIEKVPYEQNDFDNGMIDHDNNIIHMANMKFHKNVAILIVNQMLIRDELIYEKFIKYNGACYKELEFLEDEIGFIRIGILDSVLLTYRKSKISDEQASYINYLEANNYLRKSYVANKDEVDEIERQSFKPKK